jgi:hypothetical protein
MVRAPEPLLPAEDARLFESCAIVLRALRLRFTVTVLQSQTGWPFCC